MAKRDWFDEIGLSYCKNFDEVEAARDEFEQQRDAILDRLGPVVRRALNDARLKVVGEPIRDGAWDNWPIAGSWMKIRHQVGKKGDWQSGVYIGLDHDPAFKDDGGGRFGFGAGIFFSMSQNRFNKLRPSLASAAGARQCKLDYWPGRVDQCACVRSAWILPRDERFKLASFEKEIRRLPALFKEIDRIVGEAYARSKA